MTPLKQTGFFIFQLLFYVKFVILRFIFKYYIIIYSVHKLSGLSITVNSYTYYLDL